MIPAGLLEAARVTLEEIGAWATEYGEIKFLRWKYSNPLDFINAGFKALPGYTRSQLGAAYRVAGLFTQFGKYSDMYGEGGTIDRRLAGVVSLPFDQYDPSQPYRYEVSIKTANPKTGVVKEWGIYIHSQTLMTNEDILARGIEGLVNLFVTHYATEPSVADQAQWVGTARVSGFVRFVMGEPDALFAA